MDISLLNPEIINAIEHPLSLYSDFYFTFLKIVKSTETTVSKVGALSEQLRQ